MIYILHYIYMCVCVWGGGVISYANTAWQVGSCFSAACDAYEGRGHCKE